MGNTKKQSVNAGRKRRIEDNKKSILVYNRLSVYTHQRQSYIVSKTSIR